MKNSFRSDINFLRMLAIIAIVINNINSSKLAGGYLGVDILLVISAYLISSILFKEYESNGTVNLLSFYKRRIFRIAPTLNLVLFVTLCASFLLLSYNKLQPISLSAVFSNLGVANIYFSQFSSIDYFNPTSGTEPLLHLWSLGLVEQFYFLFPLSLILLWRLKKLFIYLLGLTFTSSLILSTALDNGNFVYYNLPTRAFELIAGVLASIYVHSEKNNPEKMPDKQNLVISLLSLAIIVFSLFLVGEKYRLHNYYALMIVLPTVALLTIDSKNQNNWLTKFYQFKPFQLLGLWGYSIYLWHWVLLSLVKMIFGLDLPPNINYIILLSSIGFGALSYYFVEQKTRYLKWSLKKGLIVFVFLPIFCYYYVLVFTRDIDIYKYTNDQLLEFLTLNTSLSYISLVITFAFYLLTIFCLLNTVNFKFLSKIKLSDFYKNFFYLTLLSMAIAWGWRFIAPEFIDSTPIRVLMHPNHLITFIYDTVILLTIFMLLIQIARIGRYLIYISVILIFLYTLIAFTTFFHIKRLPSAQEFELGGKILAISPFRYVILAIYNKPVLFIISYIMPLIITIISLIKVDISKLKIKLFLSFKMGLLLTMIPILTLGLLISEIHIKNNIKNYGFYANDMFFNQMINSLGLFKYQLRLLNSNVMHKSDYEPEKLNKEVDDILKKYTSDKVGFNSNMPQIILSWASESFMFPERLDPNLINQDKINPKFKNLIKQGVANGISSSFPLRGGGTVWGESTLLTSMRLGNPKQNHPSLVSYYKKLGYTTAYIHIVTDTFYNYQERSRFYGFDEIYLGSYFKTTWGDDKALFDLIEKRIVKAITNNEKLFIAFIDIGRHPPHEFYSAKSKLMPKLSKMYGSDDEGLLHYIYKGNIVDSYLGALINFLDKQKASIALMLNADHVPDGFKKNYEIEGDEARYMSEFLFYHNQKKLRLPDGYNYIYQGLVPSLFLQSLGMPLRSIDKYILEESKTQKTYKIPLMWQLPYDITLGQQISKPLFELEQ